MLGIYVVIDKLLLNDRRVSNRRDMCLYTERPASIIILFSVLRESMRPQYRITPCHIPPESATALVSADFVSDTPYDNTVIILWADQYNNSSSISFFLEIGCTVRLLILISRTDGRRTS